MASIVERRNRRGGLTGYQVQVRRKGYPVQTRTFRTFRDAELWAATVESEMGRGVWRPSAEAESTSLREALQRYRKEITPSKRGAKQEEGRIAKLLTHPIALRSLAGVRGKDVADYIRSRETDGVGPNTIRLEIAVISHLYTVARARWGMESLRNPVDLVRGARPPLPPGRDRRLKEGEEESLLAAAPPGLQAVIRWALATAMRAGEIAGLTWGQIDTKQRSAHLPVTKNGTARTVPLSRAALAVLESIPRRIDGSVFGMTTNAIRLAWHRARRLAGIEGLTFHDLRHEAISRLFENTDLDAMEIARISGRSEEHTSELQSH